jgi:hypothetical protein
MSTTQAIRQFPNYQAPNHRQADNGNGHGRRRATVPMSRGGATPPPKKEAGSSGVRPKVAVPTCDQLERMASFVSLYSNLRRELDSVLDPTRVLVLTGRLPEELDADDADLTTMLRLVNGVSSVDDVIELSGLDRAHAVSVLCTLMVARTIMFV